MRKEVFKGFPLRYMGNDGFRIEDQRESAQMQTKSKIGVLSRGSWIPLIKTTDFVENISQNG